MRAPAQRLEDGEAAADGLDDGKRHGLSIVRIADFYDFASAMGRDCR